MDSFALLADVIAFNNKIALAALKRAQALGEDHAEYDVAIRVMGDARRAGDDAYQLSQAIADGLI